ncbi:hypothetical protein KY492_02705 [Brevibacterium sp. PAMC21349]|nr:hypothetical protein KY492_02705 [Brevibacterium sp. PAMC21349]
MSSRIAAVDGGNDAIKTIFEKLEPITYIPNVIAKDMKFGQSWESKNSM